MIIYAAIAVGLVAIVGLSFYIHRQHTQIEAVKRERHEAEVLRQREFDERQTYVSESIRVIVKSLETSQIEVVEAGIRLKVLLDQLQPKLTAEPYDSIEQVFLKTQHIPKLKAWKALSKAQRKEFEREMQSVEDLHAQDVRAAAKEIDTLMAQRS